jgi:hypothetical protein
LLSSFYLEQQKRISWQDCGMTYILVLLSIETYFIYSLIKGFGFVVEILPRAAEAHQLARLRNDILTRRRAATGETG